MTYRKFNTLRLQSQADVVCTEGVFLGDRETSLFQIALYQIEGFYVEVLYHKKDRSTKFKAFYSTRLLHPYLKEINLSSLFNNKGII